MGVSKEQLLMNAELSKAFTLNKIATVSEKINNISIAQKTVNTKGIKELLSSDVLMPFTVPTTNGTPVNTILDKTVVLSEVITNFDFLSIELTIKNSTRNYKGTSNLIDLKNIVYYDSKTYNNTNGSSMFLFFNIHSNMVNSFSATHFILRGWFKSSTEIYFDLISSSLVDAQFSQLAITSIKGIKIENTTIDPVEYINTNQGIEDAPVGSIIQMMGKSCPKHYLKCNGAVYNITSYPYLADYIKNEYGSVNFFGGDGITTFAVPDYRNEFLRGYHDGKTEQLSGEIGIHQEATLHPMVGTYSTTSDGWTGGFAGEEALSSQTDRNQDLSKGKSNGFFYGTSSNRTASFLNKPTVYTSRPTNTAVLLCIKCEPTFFMSIQGMIEEKILWEGSSVITCTEGVNSFNRDITLLDNILNYDKIEFRYCLTDTSTATIDRQHKSSEVIPSEINLTDTYGDVICNISHNFTFSFIGYFISNNIFHISGTYGLNYASASASSLKLYKIVGIKYKYEQSSGGNNEKTYTDQEVSDYLDEVLYGN